MENRLICPKCKATKLVKAGKQFTAEGEKQRYQCRRCRSVTYKPITDAEVENAEPHT